MSKLNKEFDITVIEINKKLIEASNALQEANKLAQQAGLDCLYPYDLALSDKEYDEYNKIQFDKIYDALDDCGWSTSSMNC